MTEAGTRVWAVQSADDQTVYAYGFGLYLGMFPRPNWAPLQEDRDIAERAIRKNADNPTDLSAWVMRVTELGTMSREEAELAAERMEWYRTAEQAKPMPQRIDELLAFQSLNPKILLDSGGVVWGQECYWGPADEAAEEPSPDFEIGGREVVTVPAPHPADEESRSRG